MYLRFLWWNNFLKMIFFIDQFKNVFIHSKIFLLFDFVRQDSMMIFLLDILKIYLKLLGNFKALKIIRYSFSKNAIRVERLIPDDITSLWVKCSCNAKEKHFKYFQWNNFVSCHMLCDTVSCALCCTKNLWTLFENI